MKKVIITCSVVFFMMVQACQTDPNGHQDEPHYDESGTTAQPESRGYQDPGTRGRTGDTVAREVPPGEQDFPPENGTPEEQQEDAQ